MITRRNVLLGSMWLAAIPLAGAVFPKVGRGEEKPYIVGTLFPLSGTGAEYGQMFAAGADLALEHLRADNLLMHPIEIRSEDSLATPQGGAVGMNKLVNVHEAIWTLLAFTGVSKAAAPIGDEAKVVMVNGGGVGPDLGELSPYFWNVIPLLTKEVGAVIPWMAERGYKRIALVYLDDPAGQGAKRLLEAGLPGIGGELISAYPVPPTAQQFGSIAAKLRSDRPDAVYFVSYGVQQAQIVKQLRENGITQPIISVSAAGAPSVFETPESEGLIYTSQAANWESDDPVTRRFVEDWRSRHGGEPNIYHQNYYNGIRLFGLLAAALEKAGKPVNGDTLRAELLRQKSFPLVGGAGSFDDAGNITMPIQFNEIVGGKPKVIGMSTGS